MEVVGEVAGGVADLVLALAASVTRLVLGIRERPVLLEVRPVDVRDRLFLAGSSTTTQCQPWRLLPVGACMAISRQRSTTSRSTGRSKSSRLRTERVVVSTSSAVRFSSTTPSVTGHHPLMDDRVTLSIDDGGSPTSG